jgi:hypothetical protein
MILHIATVLVDMQIKRPQDSGSQTSASEARPRKATSETTSPAASTSGHAATVDVSPQAQARAALRAAGVSAADAAKINLKDAGAVAAAIKRAKAERLDGDTAGDGAAAVTSKSGT